MNVVSQDIDAAVQDFLQQHGLHHVVAFSGGTATELPGIATDDPLQEQYKALQQERETRLVSSALNILRHYRIAVLTGGTRFGFPKTAVEVAQALRMKTIGVFPETAHQKGYVLPGLDLPICVPPQHGDSAWGDESSVFAKLLNAVIVCGGSAGTLIEIAHLLKMNESLLKYDRPIKLIIPIHGTGGVADGLPFIWGKQTVKQACMPTRLITSGHDAALVMEEELDLVNN